MASLLPIRSSIRRVVGRVAPWHAAVLLVGVGVAAVLCRPDLWLVSRVVFVGEARADVKALRHLADVPNGTRAWEVWAPSVADRVERHPWVRSATAAMRLDGTLVVQVEEYVAAAVLHHDGLWLVAADGTVFSRAKGSDLDHPHVTGIEPAFSGHHPALAPAALRDALELMGQLEDRGLLHSADVSEIAFSTTSGFAVTTGAATIWFGLADHPRQLDRLSALISDDATLLSRSLEIDLAPNKVAIVRPRSAPHI